MAHQFLYLISSLRNVKKGKKVWKQLHKSIENDRDYLIIFPENDESLNQIGIKYLNEFKALHGDVVFRYVCSNQNVYNMLEKKVNCESISLLTQKQMKHLLDLYTACNFYANAIIISLQLPRGRSAERLLGVKGTSIEQIVKYGIFKLYEI